ncbi:hypothetical protein AB2B38_007750 [Balneola sp. MJW-20]|uniref:hypothetical protein n=1 Tax=Gracilimonas aurantiaca TaxID=3234185 RepID=UPI003466EC18
MRTKLFGITLLLICFLSSMETKAQTIEILAGNTFNGAMNGTLLGGATMALNNTEEFDALRIGLGLGTLYGIGTGVYDLTYGNGSSLVVSGLFNDGNNSSIIVLLDTFYGVAAGSIIVTSVLLVANEPILDGLKYGAGIGAWVGFGFGLFDAFVLADRVTGPGGFSSSVNKSENASGLIGMSFDNSKSIGLFNPTLHRQVEWDGKNMSSSLNPSVEFVNLKIRF